MNAPALNAPILAQLAPEWERMQLLAYCLARSRNGQAIGDDDLTRLRALQAEVDAVRATGSVWEAATGEQLSGIECDVLAAVLAPEVEPRLGWVFQQLQGGQSQPFPSRALIHELLALEPHQGESLRQAISPDGALARSRWICAQPDDAYKPITPTQALLARFGERMWRTPTPPGAERVRQSATWTDLVLPEDRLAMLREFMLWIDHRRTVVEEWGGQAVGGPVALFAGPSGTGKTLAASVIAGVLGWPLFRIDLGRLVSKYVGETEENLNRLFEAAHGQPMVLQFDEADALFAKRGEVREARDRYANMEVSHLLTRIESHDGPCILTTNLRRQLDPAFTRRLQMVIEFPRPDVACRAQLWSRLLPPRAPRSAELDASLLANAVTLTGGQIRNAALHAAYLAAADGDSIALRHVSLGVWRELAKDGREFAISELGSLAAHLPKEFANG